MSSQTDKYLDKALKNVGIVEKQGSGNIFANIGKAVTPHLANIGKAAGDFFSKPENQKMVLDAGAAVAANAMNQKSKGQKTVNQAKSLQHRSRQDIGKGRVGIGSIGQRIQVMAALGKTRIKIGTMRQDLLAKGVVSDMAAYETIRNALAEELYTRSFANELQKATLISVIRDIDSSLNQGFVPTI